MILFSSKGSQFGLGCPMFANINLISQKVNKMHKVDVLCGVNALLCRDLNNNHRRLYVTGADSLSHLCME